MAASASSRQLSGEVDALGEQLEARKVIDRAKGVLIDQHGMKENDAFTFIQRTAMSERSRMRDVAERILAGTLAPLELLRPIPASSGASGAAS